MTARALRERKTENLADNANRKACGQTLRGRRDTAVWRREVESSKERIKNAAVMSCV